MLAKSSADIGDAMTFLPIVASLAGLAIWIGIYTVFPHVPVRKVVPWMWAVGGLYVAGEILLTAQQLALRNLQPPMGYYLSVTGGMIALVLIFQSWFTKKGRIPPKD